MIPVTSEDRGSIAARLRAHGIRPTHQRVEIAYVLLERKQHLSADQILARANARHAETSKATVYNTLKLLVGAGLVRELIIDPSKVFYDSTTEPHHHLYNESTGELTDLPAGDISISGLPPLPPGTIAHGVDIVVRTRLALDSSHTS